MKRPTLPAHPAPPPKPTTWATAEALLRATAAIAEETDVERAFREMLRQAVELTGARYGALKVMKDGRLARFLVEGLSAEQVERISRRPEGLGLLGAGPAPGRPLRIPAIADDPRSRGFPPGHPAMGPLLAAPILRGSEVLGVLYLTGAPTDPGFTEEDERILLSLAAHAGGLLQRAELHDELRTLNRELEERVRRKTAQLNAALRQARAASHAKSAFLASMSHELRTPLNAIIGFADVLLAEYFGELNPKQREYVTDILESGQILLTLINDILDISKIESGRMELEPRPVPVADLIEASLRLVRQAAQRRGVELHARVEPARLAVEADETRLRQVLCNLLTNALKFTPAGGRVTVRATPEGRGIRVVVEDTGVGIAAGELERVFEDFYQVNQGLHDKPGGTGLGLALCRRLVAMHGGRIWAESAGPNRGSRFLFTLPARPPHIQDEGPPAGEETS